MVDIGIIGGGSLGLLIGSFLKENYNLTIYVRRDEQANQLRTYGINRATTKRKVNALHYNDMKQEDLMIVCLKQYDIESVISFINQTNQETPIVFLQNGMGHLELLDMMQQPTIVGVVEHGAYRLNDYTVEHTGKGSIKIAPYQTARQITNKIKEILQTTNFPILVSDDWKSMLIEKLIVNAVINPLTAIFNVKNGELLTNKSLYELFKLLTYETAKILQLNGQEQLERVEKIAYLTQSNYSSMVQDIQTTGRTEIEAISGYLYQQVKKKESIPYTSFVYHGVRALERIDLR